MRITSEEKENRREKMLATAFRMFSKHNIDSVQMIDIARETGYTKRSLNRYFSSKNDLVVATSVWALKSFTKINRKSSPEEKGTAAESYAFLLDSFLRMYREQPDILRFNHFFNVYIQSQRVDSEQLQPYTEAIEAIKKRFHTVYLKAEQDKTLRTDVSEEEIFSTTIHLMLSAVTRYAVGLDYKTGIALEKELLTLRNMLFREYTIVKL